MLFQQRQLLSYVSGDEWSTKMFLSENNLKWVPTIYSKQCSCVRVNGVIANYRDTQLCVEMALSVIGKSLQHGKVQNGRKVRTYEY